MATKKTKKKTVFVASWSQRMPDGKVKSFEVDVTKDGEHYYSSDGTEVFLPVTARFSKKS